MKKWTRAFYQPNRPLENGKYVTACPEHVTLSLEAASGGMVLLKNEQDTLPLKKGSKAALFGKGSFDYTKGGGGSGDVHTLYIRNLHEGLSLEGVQLYEPLSAYYRGNVQAQYAAGATPGMCVEPELPAELLSGAAAFTDTAIISISRFSGEGWDRSDVEYEGERGFGGHEVSLPRIAGKIFPEGDFYLTAEERAMVEAVCGSFDHVIVALNTGGIVETAWIAENPKIGAALLMWQGGMEGGLAAARLILGEENPSGRLPDTFARRLEDYPSTEGFHESPFYVDYTEDIYVGYRYFETIPGAAERVVYPFGYGLSYTSFATRCEKARREGDAFLFDVRVTNTGQRPGREVTELYFSAPQGKLGKPARVLGAFHKTALLLPGQEETFTLEVTLYQLASYDDLGKVAASAYVMEAGSYTFWLGENVREAQKLDYVWKQEADEVVCQLSPRLVPTGLKRRLLADGTWEELPTGPEPDLNACIFEKMVPGMEESIFPAQRGRDRYLRTEPYGEGTHTLEEVAEGKLSLDAFLEQLSDEDLIYLLGGHPNTGVANTCGFGALPEYGVPPVMTADGPAGVRIDPRCEVATTAWPCGTLLASTWDRELYRRVGEAAGEELKENNLHIWLTPAVNIHRSPLCGRNFEYLSEDPYLAGKMAAAEVQGIQSNGVACSVKHFAANNKETNRKHSNSRVSERALREIYLKVFEIIVREAQPWTIMSSYNAINGQRTSESRELLTDILRGEWGYQGMVTTDWWTRAEQYKEILAGNDVKMATGFDERVKKAMEMGALGREDLLVCARRVLELILKLD